MEVTVLVPEYAPAAGSAPVHAGAFAAGRRSMVIFRDVEGGSLTVAAGSAFIPRGRRGESPGRGGEVPPGEEYMRETVQKG